jgi:hypothetical protein
MPAEEQRPTMNLTQEALAKAEFRGPTAFYDGRNGMAQQDFECVEEPRFGYSWRREDRNDHGRQFYTVDGREVVDLAEAGRLLALPANPDSPREVRRRSLDEFKASPCLNYGATRALSEARCNAAAGPFGTVRAWLQRADNAWHSGINHIADKEREAGREWPHWLYTVKSSAHEAYRLIYLFAADRKKDTGLLCAKGERCRDCPILKEIEATMVAARTKQPFPREIDDEDIDAAKGWTCIGHILTSNATVIDGAFLTTEQDRSSTWF